MASTDTKQYIGNVKQTKKLKRRALAVLPILALFVVIIIFWWLKLIGITLAGEAFCGFDEHTHTDECKLNTLVCEEQHEHSMDCYEEKITCGIEEHTHIVTCYSDITADLENHKVWEETLPEISEGMSNADKLVEIAKSQIGYKESELNFITDSQNLRHGYTRYGDWYGNLYGDWSVMFTSFCLRYSGFESIPISSGAETLKLKWEEEGIYQSTSVYSPLCGDVVFLDKNNNGTPDSTAIIIKVEKDAITVVEGDLNNTVGEAVYRFDSFEIVGYGLPSLGNNIILVEGNDKIAQTVTYNQSLFVNDDNFVIYANDGSDYFALDGEGNAIKIEVDSNGTVISDIENIESILWYLSYSDEENGYLVCNLKTGRYMHASSDSGITTGTAYPNNFEETEDGVTISSNGDYITLDSENGKFVSTKNGSVALSYNLARAATQYTIWLDGTNGGMMSLGGSPDTSYSYYEGDVIKLPSEWQSPAKYSYKLRGWYDVKNAKYYPAGAEITISEHLVFYADWVSDSYDIGKFNTQVTDTVSTNNFITTHVFDYNSLFNVMSVKPTVNVSASSHSESWSQVTSGRVPYKNANTIDYVFVDYDASGDISYPSNRNSNNVNGGVYSGLYNANLGSLLFGTDNLFDPSTGNGVIGKNYIGTADHLFKYDLDPTSSNYGYYYYDSKLNAASYNQADKRFYVYDYLERTADSEKDGGGGAYSDFLPFNSPYVNTNGKTVKTFTYAGENNEYNGVTHYQYDAKYNSNNNSTSNVGTNYWFGMSIDIDFFLPNEPGFVDLDGYSGNRDLHGNEMHFRFSGDDDVWVLLDGELVLDIGGVHGIESGDINFSTGDISINGSVVDTLDGVTDGHHILTVYYLERGSSQSNCAIYFNLAPRFHLTIQKEDVLEKNLLNGAEFTVYTDSACTIPAELWTTHANYIAGEEARSTFTVVDGETTMWGFAAGVLYYIKETKPPDGTGYVTSHGIIRLYIDKGGQAHYEVEIIPEYDENGNEIEVTNGFTVYGLKINEETHEAFIVITNAKQPVPEVTKVRVLKEWADNLDHSNDSVIMYLNVTLPDGTVRRIQEATLNEANGWSYTWENLPKYDYGTTDELIYTVEEGYVSGYSGVIEKLDSLTITQTAWDQETTFTNGESYLLKTSAGYLSTTGSGSSSSDLYLKWVDEATAKQSPLALWTATVSGTSVTLINGAGQKLSYNSGSSNSNRYFRAVASTSNTNVSIPFTSNNSGTRLSFKRGATSYYMTTSINSSGRATTNSSSTNSAVAVFTPVRKTTTSYYEDVDYFMYRVTNVELEEETSLKVNKVWDCEDKTLYEQKQITVKLYANGKEMGKSVVLTFKNEWTATFEGLPYKDSDGNVIVYSVVEVLNEDNWVVSYGDLVNRGGTPPQYQITVTNRYVEMGPELPSTGGYGRTVWIISGLALMLLALSAGILLRVFQKRKAW